MGDQQETEQVSQAKRHPLYDIDSALERLTSSQGQAGVANVLSEFCSAIARCVNGLAGSGLDPLDAVFNQNLPSSERQLVAASLLRFMCASPGFLGNQTFSVRAMSLFDDVYGDGLYRRLGIGAGDQGFRKEQELRSVVTSTEQKLRGAVKAITRVETVREVKSDLLRTFNALEPRLIVHPFLPPSLIGARLKELLSVVEYYVAADPPLVLSAYKQARDVVGRYEEEALRHGTTYALEFSAELAQRLRALLDRSFEENPASKPASITLRLSDKKYPLNDGEREFPMAVIVRNAGPGHAFAVSLRVRDALGLETESDEVYLGDLDASSVAVELGVRTVDDSDVYAVEVCCEWKNLDGTLGSQSALLELEAQGTGVNWANATQRDPYNLEPVSSETDLVGRGAILKSLLARVKGASVGSSLVWGQKRVGKTSIAKTLVTQLQRESPEVVAIYLESGDYIEPDADSTLKGLGAAIVRELGSSLLAAQEVEPPEFTGSLAPLTTYLQGVSKASPSSRIVIILDEFDELPPTLYEHTPVGDAFFQNIRGISNKAPFGFMLVGGERMQLVLNSQGERLNKFVAERVDYFDRKTAWPDFVDLVRRPVEGILEVSDGAVALLYEQTSGNPYYTKLICRGMYAHAVARRDGHITDRDVGRAVRSTLDTVAANSFQHFWDDGVFYSDSRAREKSKNRKRVLLALGDLARRGAVPIASNISEQAAAYGLDSVTVTSELTELVQRQVLVNTDDGYYCKVPFFMSWLKDRGMSELLTDFSAESSQLKQREREEKLYVRSGEITSLVERWGPYKGRSLNEERVRAWLEQFETIQEQRLAFKLAEGIRFFGEDVVREKLVTTKALVLREMRLDLSRGSRLSEILVSYLGDAAKSGAGYARLFAREAKIYTSNVVPAERLMALAAKQESAQAIVFVEDFVGTGKSASASLKGVAGSLKSILARRSLAVHFIAISGYESGAELLRRTAKSLDVPVEVTVLDEMTDADKCFDPRAGLFASESEREQAQALAVKYGRRLVPSWPLGFDESQALTVFFESCPNNTLPILWSNAGGWIPLFSR